CRIDSSIKIKPPRHQVHQVEFNCFSWCLGVLVVTLWIIDHWALESSKSNQGWPHVEYRVELEVYNGPLDLLLYLIKKDELDIYDIPIASITDSYLHYVGMLKEMSAGGLDINVAGDFLVMAATLMEIKSAMLLPKAPVIE